MPLMATDRELCLQYTATCNFEPQACDVNKALLSVSRMVQAGNTVVFSKSGSYVEDESTRERIPLREQGGMYMLKL